MKDKPVYYDTELKQFYWIEWKLIGSNLDVLCKVPTKHYIECKCNDIVSKIYKNSEDVKKERDEIHLINVED